MKVNTSTPIPQVFERITGKSSDKQGGAGQNAYERQQRKKEDPPTEEEVLKAVETYGLDETIHENGITASSEGQGPGLKVILKDASGGVLRAVSGEEFLKLREAVKNGSRSGRILDQKA